MGKEELLDILNNAMTVGQLISILEKFDKNMIVINSRDKEYLPINSVEKEIIDYCYDEIISKEVISIW